MMVSTSGVVIKETKLNESDKILTFLTADGIMQAVAKRCRNTKSKLQSGANLFCFSEFTLQKGKGELSYITELTCIESFYGLRHDIEKVSLAVYFADLLNLVCVKEDSTTILKLFLNTLYYLVKYDNIFKVKSVFEFKLAVFLGFTPNLTSCNYCGDSNAINHFDDKSGIFSCDSCSVGMKFSQATLNALEYVLEADLKKIFSFEISSDVLSEFSAVTENYLCNQLGRYLDSLKYFKEICYSSKKLL